MSTTDPAAEPVKSITLRVPETLDDKVTSAARETGLARADILRLSLDRGIDTLLKQLRGEADTAAA